MGLTPYADMTNEEFLKVVLMPEEKFLAENKKFLSPKIQQDFDISYFDRMADEDDHKDSLTNLTRGDIDWPD